MEAVLGLIGVVTVALIAGHFQVKTTRLSRAVGRPNGQGNVVQMNERILMELGRLHEKQDTLQDSLDDHMAQDAAFQARVEPFLVP